MLRILFFLYGFGSSEPFREIMDPALNHPAPNPTEK